MFAKIRDVFGGSRPVPHKGGALYPESQSSARPKMQEEKKQTFTKVFRYRLPDGQTAEPSTVEVIGSFTQWQRVSLLRDGRLDAWHTTIHHIPGNRTHHYMLLIDGKPTYDHTCDGLAAPHNPQEERYHIPTERGPRVLMLFAQTK